LIKEIWVTHFEYILNEKTAHGLTMDRFYPYYHQFHVLINYIKSTLQRTMGESILFQTFTKDIPFMSKNKSWNNSNKIQEFYNLSQGLEMVIMFIRFSTENSLFLLKKAQNRIKK